MKKIYLFMLMAVGLLISGNLRAGNVAKIGDTEYATLQAAFDAVPTDGTETEIQLIDDIEFEKASGTAYTIASNKNVYLDLNGHKIVYNLTTQAGACVINNSGTLTIDDKTDDGSGVIELKGQASGGANQVAIITAEMLTIKGGNIFNSLKGNYAAYAIDVYSNNADFDQHPINKLVIEGGVIAQTTWNHPAVRAYGIDPTNANRYTNIIEMKGGKVWGQRGFYLSCKSDAPISLSITGGEIEAKDGQSGMVDFRAIDSQLESNNGDLSKVTINISGNPVIKGFICLADLQGDYTQTTTENISIEGGNFVTNNGVQFVQATKVKAKNFITGGTYFFTQTPQKETVISRILFNQTDAKGTYACTDDLIYARYTDKLANKEGWEALGYIVDPIDFPNAPREGQWYCISKMTKSAEDYSAFIPLIKEGYTAVDITGQNDGNGGKYPEKTVIVKQVETKEISQNGELPETKPNDAVVIKNNANITISGEKEVEVYSLNVEVGSSLTVGADATVIVGAGGVTGNSVITVKADGSGMGVFKIDPSYEMTEENRPTISVDLYTKARTVDGVSYWQFFARPTGVTPTAFYPTVETSSLATIHNIYGWDAEKKEYVPIMNKEGLNKSFTGYAISNNSPAGGVVYHFEGKLNENENGKLPMTNSGFNLVGNSYIAPVALKEMLASIAVTEGLGDKVELSIWYYDSDNGSFKAVTSLRSKDYQLQPLQGFFMYNMSSDAIGNAQIDYLNAVWNNNKPAGPLPAPAHGDVAQMTMAQIIVSANGNADIVEVFEDAQFSADFDNGADASKLMNPSGMFNLYSSDNLASVATDNLDGVQLTFKANDASTYTMSFNEVAGDSFMILDKETGIYTTISNSETYTFQAQPNTTYADRFCLVAGHKAPTNATKVEANKSTKGIYSIMGQYFGTNRNALPAGVYIENGQKIVK